MSGLRPLPAGWERAYSRTDGEEYYVNTVTNASTFDFPTQPAVPTTTSTAAAGASLANRSIETVPGDGQCLFNSIDQTQIRGGSVHGLRKLVVEWVRDNWSANPDVSSMMPHLAELLQNGKYRLHDMFEEVESERDLEDYLQRMARYNEYGSDREAAIAAYIRGYSLTIYHQGKGGDVRLEVPVPLGMDGGVARSIVLTDRDSGCEAHYDIYRPAASERAGTGAAAASPARSSLSPAPSPQSLWLELQDGGPDSPAAPPARTVPTPLAAWAKADAHAHLEALTALSSSPGSTASSRRHRRRQDQRLGRRRSLGSPPTHIHALPGPDMPMTSSDSDDDGDTAASVTRASQAGWLAGSAPAADLSAVTGGSDDHDGCGGGGDDTDVDCGGMVVGGTESGSAQSNVLACARRSPPCRRAAAPSV
jgi:hypothetical protein